MCPTYSYECSKCEHQQDEYHSMNERPFIHCNKCRGASVKLIGCGSGFVGLAYKFIDYNTTGKPVEINSKSQWDRHLKAHGLNDDVSNAPLRMEDLKTEIKVDKKKQKAETRQAIVAAVKDKKFKAEIKQKISKQLYEARNK